MIRTLSLMACLTAFSAITLHAQEPAKQAVPSEAERAAALEKVQSVYKDKCEEAKTDLQKVELAKTLLNDARATNNNPAARYALLRVAKDIAAGVGHLETSSAAIEELDRHYEVDRLELEATAMLAVTRAAKLPLHYQALVPEFIRLIERALSNDRFDVVAAVTEQAEFASRRARDGQLKEQLDNVLTRFGNQREAFQAAAEAREVLKERPTDPAANLVVGKYRCFMKGNWEDGIPMLALGDDKQLAELAIASLKKSAAPLALGDRWWDYAEELPADQRQFVRGYAVTHYRQALASLDGFNQARVGKRIDEHLASTLEPTGPFPQSLLLLTFDEKTFSVGADGKNRINDLSGRNHHGVITTIRMTEGRFGEALQFKKTESVIMPTLRDDLIGGRESLSLCCWSRTSESRSQSVFDVGFGIDTSITLLIEQSRHRFALANRQFDPGVTDVTQWHHVAMSWDGSTVKLFLDGELTKSAEVADFALTSKTITAERARIGRHAKEARTLRWLEGEVDDFAIFAGPLTEAQVKAIYVKGLVETLK